MLNMNTITAIKISKPTPKELQAMGISRWPIWTKEPSTFDWHYDSAETCYFLEGDVVIKVGQEQISIGKGDLVIFPKGMDCTWQVKQAVRKYYNFG